MRSPVIMYASNLLAGAGGSSIGLARWGWLFGLRHASIRIYTLAYPIPTGLSDLAIGLLVCMVI